MSASTPPFMPNYAPLPMQPVRGEGARLWDAEGREYLDFTAGIAVCALGHASPVLNRVLTAQADQLWHISNIFVNQPARALAERLCELTFAERVFFANSGSEANEAAFKLARRHAYLQSGPQKSGIIAFEQAFHGRTWFTVCVGGQPKYREGFGPPPGGIRHLPLNDIAALEAAVGADTCAVVVEPVQGEGGVRPAEREFLAAARQLCDEHQALLIFDEVQTGAGRSGSLYAYQQLEVVPDLLTTAKGLGGGFPISALLARAEVADSLTVGSHGSTFGGNPLACAVGLEVLNHIARDAFLSDVAARGAQLRAGLEELGGRHGCFDEVRGMGLLLGAALSEAWRGRARELMHQALERELLILTAGDDVLRFAPPLMIEAAQIDEGLARLEAVFAEAGRAA